MPHVDTLMPKKHAFAIRFGQRPLTAFKNYRDAIKVDLIKWDDPSAMMKGTYDFVKATWSEDGKESSRATEREMEYALQQMMEGKALGLGLETMNFMFRISGITRIDTHQIVRQRIGVTFSQQCSGDQFWHHQNCLVEPSIYYSPDWNRYKEFTLEAKNLYAQLCDDGISIQAARSVLPHNLETFIFMNTNLATLLFFHQKRIDDGSQTWQINEIAQQMANEASAKFPALFEMFEKNKKRFKFQRDASADRQNTFSTALYLPEEDNFEYHKRDFLYDQRKKDMHGVGPANRLTHAFTPKYYWGHLELTEAEYWYIYNEYKILDENIHDNPKLSNEGIRTMAINMNDRIHAQFATGTLFPRGKGESR
jgi:thymidylate synthase ThyX